MEAEAVKMLQLGMITTFHNSICLIHSEKRKTSFSCTKSGKSLTYGPFKLLELNEKSGGE